MLHLSTEVDIEFNVMQFIKVYVRYCRSFARSCGLCEQRESQRSTSHIIKSMGVINMYANKRARALFCACTWNCIEIFCFFFLVSVFITYMRAFANALLKRHKLLNVFYHRRILFSSIIIIYPHTVSVAGDWCMYSLPLRWMQNCKKRTNEGGVVTTPYSLGAPVNYLSGNCSKHHTCAWLTCSCTQSSSHTHSLGPIARCDASSLD